MHLISDLVIIVTDTKQRMVLTKTSFKPLNHKLIYIYIYIYIYISHVPHQILLQIINKLWSFILNHGVIILVHSVLSQHFKPKDQAGNAYLPPYHDAIFGFWPIIIYILLYFFDKGFWQFQTTANGVVRGLSKITWLKF